MQSRVLPGLGRHDTRRLGFIPPKLRATLRAGVDTWGEWTSSLRVMPSYLIVGAMRSGTSALYEYLVRHPAVARSTTEEVHYFTLRYDKGPAWYRGHFPSRLRREHVRRRYGLELVTGEATPYYLFHPHAPGRIASLLPDVKLIVVLRDPVDRAYSHYVHARKVGVEPLPTFEEALAAEPRRLAGEVEKMHADPGYRSRNHWHFAYVGRGIYVDQLQRLLSLFARDQILVLQAEEMLRATRDVHARVLGFLGLPVMTLGNYAQHNRSRYSPMKIETRRRLAETFEEPNRRLYDLLGVDYAWGASPAR